MKRAIGVSAVLVGRRKPAQAKRVIVYRMVRNGKM